VGGGRAEKGAAGLAGARRAAWADGTGDGLPDLLLATAAGPRLLVGTGSEPPFRDASEGLPRLPAWNLLDAAWIDADFDGRLDILLANGFHGVRLFRNLGVDAGAAPPACRFADLGSLEWEEAPGEEGAAPGGGGGAGLEGGGGGARKARGDFRVRGLLVAQLDGDSLDDVLLLGERPLLLTRAPGGGFRAASRPPSLAGASRPAAGDFDRDGDLDVFVPEGAFGRLLENAGDARFHEVTTRAIGPVLGATGRASGAAWGDLDGDGRLDLLVTATGGPNRILLGGEGARLSDASRDLGLDLEVFHTGGGALSDLDGDGDLDLALANDGGPSAVLFSALGGAVRRPGAPASSPPLSSPPLSSPPLSPEEGGAAPPAADAPSPARAEWEWPTYRGDLRRSGTAGSSPGPRVPAVLWSLPGKSHYLAAPAPGRGSIYLPALGPFNSALALAVDVDPAAERRVRWQKSPPAITLPPACSPVVAEGVVLFGEGMHQNAAGALAAFSAADGLPLWRLEVEGELRHVEGSPAVEGGRIYFGCGSGGVLCADLRRIRMEGRELAPEAAAARVWERWQEFLAAYEKEKASDPDFAVEPDESALPSGTVEVLWTAGADAWHVDTPVAVIGERVIAASSYLDEEKKGTRALFALAAADGRIEWQVRLRWNPWGAPSALRREEDGEALILVGSSSVRYDPARLRGARGEVVAVELESGRLRWRREVPGGVLSPVSIAPSGELGVFTATDGMVRALRTETGEIAWSHRSDSPYFAGVALASARVYAADLDGAVRALDLQSGAEVWRLDLASHPRVGLPGRVYAPPLCAGERLYVATANVEGPHAGKPTAIVAIGEEAPREASRGVTLEREKRRVVIDARMAPRKLPHLEGIYPIEVLAAQPHGAKAHETVVTIDAMPSAIHEALEALGLHAGTPGLGEEPGRGPEVRIAIEFEGPGGVARRVEAGDSVLDRRTGLPLGKGLVWRFTGSSPVRLDPTQETESYGADSSGTFACVYPVSRETVIQSSLGMDDESVLELEVAPWMPPVGTAVRLIVLVETGKEAR
jgi:outer membrane protein assembly factor BamB